MIFRTSDNHCLAPAEDGCHNNHSFCSHRYCYRTKHSYLIIHITNIIYCSWQLPRKIFHVMTYWLSMYTKVWLSYPCNGSILVQYRALPLSSCWVHAELLFSICLMIIAYIQILNRLIISFNTECLYWEYLLLLPIIWCGTASYSGIIRRQSGHLTRYRLFVYTAIIFINDHVAFWHLLLPENGREFIVKLYNTSDNSAITITHSCTAYWSRYTHLWCYV